MMFRQKNFSAALAACGAIGVLTVALSLAASDARAEAARADPIDTAMQNCLARADRSTTAGQVQCIDAARDAWQAAIDAALRSISASAPDDDRRGWEASQRKWLAWRKEEVPLVHAVFDTTKGGAYSITQANVLLQSVRDRALAVRHAASRFAPPPPAAASGASTAGASASSPGSAAAGSGAAGTSIASAVASAAATRAQSEDARAHNERMRPCTADAACEHAQFDLRRYTRALREKLPAHARPVLLRAQRAWTAYFDATSPLGTEAERADLIGERVATVKRLSETVGND
ncbi:lysozyme inhibitor LprI family protein [Trinickia sp.]|uniref:lysozyme inhibitor LprI family protein n=1 Tax=Trinickia sp. TaxID=2571163 RepID=UPI003F7F5118